MQAVSEYTRETIAAFREAGVLPDMVQIGNEITNGMLWPDGKLPDNWDNFADLLKAGIAGVEAGRGGRSRPRIMIHIDKGGDKAKTKWFFDKLHSYGVTYDVHRAILLSVVARHADRPAREPGLHGHRVPQGHHGGGGRLQLAAPRVHEAARAFPESPEGQREFLDEVNRVVLSVPDGLGKGVFWWEPAVTGGLIRRGFFDNDGNALPVITVFDKYTRH